MGGEKFDTPQPEAYLFGDNMDLNFLGNKPIPVSLNSVWILCIIKYCHEGIEIAQHDFIHI